MISKRTEEMTSFIVMDVLERAQELEREGARIIHLEVGEPDFDTPDCVKEAACKALEDGFARSDLPILPQTLSRICRSRPGDCYLRLFTGHISGLRGAA
jgi:aspartate/methionine/tyrosine aminotransferase